MLMDSHPSQHHVGLQRAVFQLQQEETSPSDRFRPTLPKKSKVDVEQTYQLYHTFVAQSKITKWIQVT